MCIIKANEGDICRNYKVKESIDTIQHRAEDHEWSCISATIVGEIKPTMFMKSNIVLIKEDE